MGRPRSRKRRRPPCGAVESGDAATLCRKQVSKGYLERIYDGDVAACVKSEGSVPEEASTARARNAVVKGGETHAEVSIVLTGGSYDGASGGVEMVKEGESLEAR